MDSRSFYWDSGESQVDENSEIVCFSPTGSSLRSKSGISILAKDFVSESANNRFEDRSLGDKSKFYNIDSFSLAIISF